MTRKLTVLYAGTLLSALALSFATIAQNAMPEMIEAFPAEQTLYTAETPETFEPNAPAAVADQEAFSVASGEWNQPWVWDCGCVPDETFDVTIMNGDSVTVSNNAAAVNLTINAGAYFELSAATPVEMNILGDWTNNGEFLSGISAVTLNGDAIQQIIGANDFFDLNVASAEGVVLMGATGVKNLLYLNTVLTTNTNLLLKSNGVGSSGALAPVMSGSLDGMLGLERSVTAAYTGWLTIGAPFTNATIEQWNDDFVTTGFEGSDYPTNSFVSIRTYDETAILSSESFLAVESTEDLIVPGLGYYVYANPGTYTFDVYGNPVIGNIDMPVSFTDTGNPTQDGLNVLANPYPSNINWDSDGWTKTNMYSAIYVWDVGLNQFRTYSNGYGVNGGTPLIRSGEAFWVQANGADPQMTLNETAKVPGEWTPEVNTGDQFLRLRIDGLGLGDEIIVAFDENATTNFDQNIDAFKFESSNAVLTMMTQSDDGTNLAINNVPLQVEAFDIPIYFTAQEEGMVTMTVENFPNISDRCLYLEDTETGDLYSLAEEMTNDFNTTVVAEQQRFILHVGQSLEVIEQPITCFGDSDGSIEVTGAGPGPWTYTWTDGEGNVIQTDVDSNESSSIAGLGEGSYAVSVSGNPVCAVLSKTFEFVEPAEIMLTSSHADIGCGEENTGSIAVEFSGGAEPLSGEWLNGDTSNELTGLESGTYVFTVTDANGCQRQETVVIDQAPTVVADFTPSAQIINLADGLATVDFENLSENGEMFVWNFGDGGMPSMDENPSHTYTEAGSYIVALEVSNDECSDTHQSVVIVQEGMSVDDLPIDQSIEVFMQGHQPVVQFRHSDKRNYSITAHNLLGQQLISPITGNYGGQTVKLNLLHMVPAALITIRNTSTGESHTFKILR